MAMRVKFLSLRSGVEDTEKRCGVSATSGYPLPTRGIVGQIRIHKIIKEPRRSGLPWDQKVFG